MALKIEYAKSVLISPDLKKLCADPDQAFAADRRYIKSDNTTTLSTLPIDIGEVVVKRYNTKNLWHQIRRNFQVSRAFNCMKMSKSFSDHGIQIAQPLASIESVFGPIRGNSWFVSKWIDGQMLIDYLRDNRESADVDIIADQIKQTFRILLDQKMSHGDMKATNILLVDQNLCFIDLDGASMHLSKTAHRRAILKDARRFMKNWQANTDLKAVFNTALVDCGIKVDHEN